MKSLFLAAAVALTYPSFAAAQCDPVADLSIVVSPSVASPGQLVTVTVTNTSATCTYTLPSGCVFQNVTAGDCTGATVTSYFCTLALKPIGPGKSVSQTWDQVDDNGQQVALGTYAFPIRVFDPAFTLHELCATVDVGPTCPNPPTTYGAGDQGAGGFVPFIAAIGGLPTLGNNTFAITVSNGVGGAQAAFFIGAAPANLAAPWGTFYLDPNLPLIQLNLTLSGANGQPGAGSVLLPTPIPQLPQLLGVNVYTQMLIADPASIGGISHTAGLTFGICQ